MKKGKMKERLQEKWRERDKRAERENREHTIGFLNTPLAPDKKFAFFFFLIISHFEGSCSAVEENTEDGGHQIGATVKWINSTVHAL